MKQISILLGGNIGDTVSIFENCCLILNKDVGTIVSRSSVYKSPSWGFDSDPFFNQALLLNTQLEADELIVKVLSIEKSLGRLRSSQAYTARVIDIDLIFFGNEIISKQELQIPHPRYHLRKFALVPLHDIIPDFIDPVFGMSIRELLNNCPDQAASVKIKE